MGKRTASAFLLSLLVIISYNYFLAKQYPQQPETRQVIKSAPVPPQTSQVTAAVPAVEGISVGGELKTAKEIVVETDLATLVLTSSGARIKSCKLKAYPEEKLTLQAIHAQIKQIEQQISRASDEKRAQLQREKNKLILLQQTTGLKGAQAELVSLAAGLDSEFSPAIVLPSREKTSTSINTELYQCNAQFLNLNQGKPEGRLEFFYRDRRGREITKIYTFSNSSYLIGLEIKMQGWSTAAVGSDHFLLFYGPDIGMPLAKRGRRTMGYEGPLGCFQTGEQVWVQKEKYSSREQAVFTRREYNQDMGKIAWAALENKYFITALIPVSAAEAMVIDRNKYGEHKVGLKLGLANPGSYKTQLYLGPKKQEMLKMAGASLEKSIDYGFFSLIARFIYRTLVLFSRWTKNFGWAIVLLWLLVKIAFYPLTHHSFEAMQKMQREMKEIQPEMTELRQRLKDSPQKLNKEMLELYRRKGVNPLAGCQSGCLPLLLQLPVFFALYAVLYNAIELRGAPFIGWISDLSAKDPLYILPILMGISMFAQQKLTGIGSAGGAQEEQARLMAIIMPVMLTWIFASLPSGVVLYWLTFNIFTALQQLLIKKKQEAVN